MKKNKVLVGCLAAILLVLIIGAGMAIFIARIPPVSAQIVSGSAYMLVTLSSPLTGASLPLNSFTQVNVDAVGQRPLRRLEFWVDNQLIAQNNLPDGSTLTSASAFWSWTPPQAGDYTLLVRAYDSDNHFALSNAVRVHADDSADRIELVSHKVQSGDTLDSLAKQNNISTSSILSANPGLAPDGSLPSGGSLNIPVPAPPVLSFSSTGGTETKSGGKPTPSPTSAGSSSHAMTLAAPTATPTQMATPGPTTAPGSSNPAPGGITNVIPKDLQVANVTGLEANGFSFFIKNKIVDSTGSSFNSSNNIQNPAISADVQGCNANLRIYSPSISVEAYLLYRLDPLSTSYKLIATLPSTSSKLVLGYLDTSLFGKFSYYVVTVSGPIQESSAIVDVTISDPACNQGQWSSLVVTQASMTTTSPMAGGIYCYLSLNNNPWGRMPVAGTIPYSSSGYDLKPYFPNITLAPMPPTILVTLDCWGYNGGALSHLGKANKSFSSSGLPVAVVISGTGFTATIVFDKGAPPPGSQTAPSGLTPAVSLRGGQNTQDCVSHMGSGVAELFTSLVCGSAISNHYEILIWEWKPTACQSVSLVICSQNNMIDGYRIYRVTNSGQTALVDEKQGVDVKADAFPQPALDASGNPPCYIVRTFKGTAESINSNLFCLPASAPGSVTLKLTPNDIYTQNATNEGQSKETYCVFTEKFFGSDYNGPIVPSSDGNIAASYDYNWDPGKDPLPCWWYTNGYGRGVVGFNMSAVPNKVYSAVLTFTANNNTSTCGASLNMATTYDNQAVLGFDSLNDIDTTPNQSQDVSNAVRNWQMTHAGGTMDFMINTNYENLNARDNNSCGVSFGNFLLTVTYFTQ
ncbi:MAG: LysM peptidoglycan-binding domain-containing protein [Anaerolineaceae bacterium]|nr:LysM peptidoglycan-binding domain-containing protein [Anaerolineaceae bacterium]